MAVANPTTEQAILSEVRKQNRDRRALRLWLGFVLLALFCLVLVGGATRLTNSGLSITEWKPIHGVIPPLSAAEWEEEFRLYQRIPEFQQLNDSMTVDEFKGIFWWEWAHRLIARGIGVIFALPLIYFWLTGRIENVCAGRSSASWRSAACRVLSVGGWYPRACPSAPTSASTGSQRIL